MRAALVLGAVLLGGCLHSRPAPDEQIERTAERVARGEYLARSALACLQCHSEPDENAYGRPPRPGTEGTGGQCFDESTGAPGLVCASNLTTLQAFTDGELMRAIREGISADGSGLFPLMPYRDYASLSDEDTRAIVAYLRTLAPVQKTVPTKKVSFPASLFIRLVPRPLAAPVPEVDRADTVGYGRYLGKVCVRCHSEVDSRGRLRAGHELSGGQRFTTPGGTTVVSPNLTAHRTGLGEWTREQFVARFKGATAAEVDSHQNTVMPWLSFAGLAEDDLGALWEWLRTVPPRDHRVQVRP